MKPDDDTQAAAVNQQRALTAEKAVPSETDKEQQKAAGDFKGSKDAAATMHVKVYSPFRNYYDGQALSITAVNATGPFDILAHHHNFISLLDACDLIIRTPHDEQKIVISGGIMHVKADEVIVFLDV